MSAQNASPDRASLWVIVPFVVAVIGTVVMLFTNSANALKIALIFALWAGAAGVIVSRDRTRAQEEAERSEQLLADATDVLGAERRAAVCRELTKTYEEIKRGTLGELAEWAEENARGEITVVIEGGAAEPASLEELLAEVRAEVERGVRAKQACKQAAAGTEWSNRELYDAYLAARD